MHAYVQLIGSRLLSRAGQSLGVLALFFIAKRLKELSLGLFLSNIIGGEGVVFLLLTIDIVRANTGLHHQKI